MCVSVFISLPYAVSLAPFILFVCFYLIIIIYYLNAHLYSHGKCMVWIWMVVGAKRILEILGQRKSHSEDIEQGKFIFKKNKNKAKSLFLNFVYLSDAYSN